MTRTYGGLIRELGLTPCHGITPTGHYCPLTSYEHARGTWSRTMNGLDIVHILDGPIDVGYAHWADMKRFLLVCARALDYSLNPDIPEPIWRKVYRGNMAARAVGKRLHIRVPARYHRFDKTVVLMGTTGLANDVPFRKEAYDWARR
jgi:hypothetical protein